MHRSRRVEVGIRADDPNLHTPYDGDRITTPWKRSKNTLVQDEWVYRTGALSPKSGRREHESRGGERRAHTALGLQSSNSVGFGQGSHDSLVQVQHSQHSQPSLSGLRMRSESVGSPSMEPEPWRQPVLKLPDSACGKYQTGRLVEGYTSRSATPLLWVQDRYFTKPKTQQEGRVTSCGVGAEGRGDLAPRDSSTFSASLRDKIWRLPGYHPKKRREEDSTNFLREHGYGISEYEKHASSVRGEISATWLRQTAPFFWPARVGQTKPHKQTKDDFDTSDPEYLQNLPIKTTATLNGRVTCILAKGESQNRKDMLRGEEAQEVACLETPREAKEEQILEEALRNLQGEGPMERIQAKLLSLDTLKSGKIGVSKFTEIVVSETNLRAMHIGHLIRAAGTEPGKEDREEVVKYQTFIDIIRIARNRKMASLQRAKVLTMKGLKRWQSNSLVRIVNFWKMYCKISKNRRKAHML